jgi:hypothetical protein
VDGDQAVDVVARDIDARLLERGLL